MDDTNNFHGFFPGGYLRQVFYNKGDVPQIIEEVDKLIKETDFDINIYIKLNSENLEASSKITELWDKAREEGKQVLEPYLEKMDETSKKREEMIIPIYHRLLEMGYNETQLRQ